VTAFLAALAPPAPTPDWNAIFPPGADGSKTTWGVVLGGTVPFARNEDRPFTPASNTKLFVAQAALEHLGPEFQFETQLEWVENAPGTATDLEIFGHEDPSLSFQDLRAMARELRAAGLRKVSLKAASAAPRTLLGLSDFDFPGD